MIRRLGRWLDGQPDTIIAAVLGLYPASARPDIAKLLLERMAGDPAPFKWPAPGSGGMAEVAEAPPMVAQEKATGRRRK